LPAEDHSGQLRYQAPQLVDELLQLPSDAEILERPDRDGIALFYDIYQALRFAEEVYAL